MRFTYEESFFNALVCLFIDLACSFLRWLRCENGANIAYWASMNHHNLFWCGAACDCAAVFTWIKPLYLLIVPILMWAYKFQYFYSMHSFFMFHPIVSIISTSHIEGLWNGKFFVESNAIWNLDLIFITIGAMHKSTHVSNIYNTLWSN